MSLHVRGPAHCLFASLLAAAAGAQHEHTTLRIEREIVLRGGISCSLAWSRDGKRIASGGYCGDVLVVDADTGRVVHELLAADDWIGAVLFAPDGGTLFVGGRDLTRWDLGSGKQTARTALCHPTDVALTRDGARIACVSDRGTVELRNARDFGLERTLTLPDETADAALAFDRRAERLAVGKHSGKTYVFTIASGEIVEQPGLLACALVAYRDDDRLVRLGNEGTLVGFTDRDESLGTRPWSMSFDDDARVGVTWDQDYRQVRGFTRDGPAFVVPGTGPAAVHPDGSSWVRAHDGKLEFRRGDELVRTLPLAHRARPGAVVFVGDGKHLAIGTQVFDLASGAAVPIPEGVLRGQPIEYPGGAELALWEPKFCGSGVGTLSLWSIGALRAGERRPVREHCIPCSRSDCNGSAPVFSSDGRFFAVNDTVRDALQPEQQLWRARDECVRNLHPLPGGRSAWAATVSSDGFSERLKLQLLAADGKNGPEREFWSACALDWSPDDSSVLLGTLDGVHVVDTDSGTSLGFLRDARQHCKWIANDRLLSLRYGGELELIAVPACAAIATLDLPCTWGWIAKAADGRRAAIATHDRVIVVRVGGG